MLTLDLSKPQIWLLDSLNSTLFKVGGENISVLWIVKAITIFLVVGLLIKIFKGLLKNRILLKLGISEGNRELIATLTSFSIGALIYTIILQSMGLNLASLAVVAGGLGVGIGFGIQDLTKNLTSGFLILIERKLKVGDLIQFNSTMGYINEISIRSTVIHTFRGSELIVPNTYLTNNLIENWNYQNCQGRIDLPVQVTYDNDPLLVTEVLLNSAFMETLVLRTPPPKVILSGFRDNALNFELLVWVERIDQALTIKSSLNFIIEYNLRQRNIKMPVLPRYDSSANGSFVSETTDVQQEVLEKSLSNPPTLKDLLLQVSYFQDFNDLQLRHLIERGILRHFNSGEVLFRQGEYAAVFCIILSGAIEAIYENQKISRKLITFKTGEYFGELPLLLDIPYPTTMLAAIETTLFLIDKEGFQYLLQNYPKLAEDVAQEFAKRQDVLEEYKKMLQEMGLIDEQNLKSPIDWIRDSLSKIFSP